MKRISLLILMLSIAPAGAEVFKRVGPDGKVYFSDKPSPGAERIDVGPVQTITLPPVPEGTGAGDAEVQAKGKAEGAEDGTPAYTEFTIVSPTPDEAIRANDGNITVSLSLQPALRPGHKVALKLDGEDGKQLDTGDSLKFELNNLSRGRHTVAVTVIDETGEKLIQAGPVSFNVLRFAAGG